ncbi:hypothetical protein [Photorhabdus noenieputensis]|nr:hypothetical protein [Photorhabdus noenieputensis]MCK3671147.1 hypothetical protein [Photorhabdus noenieputensis]
MKLEIISVSYSSHSNSGKVGDFSDLLEITKKNKARLAGFIFTSSCTVH